MKRLLSKTPWVVVLVLGVWGATAAAFATETPATAVLAGACLDCHGDVASHLALSPHGKAFVNSAAYAGTNCETCHGPGQKHAESADPADIENPVRAKGAARNAACLTCHENQKHSALWAGSAHEAARVGCVDCHSVHAEGVERQGKVLTGNSLCVTCHAETRVALNQRSHHPLGEGKMMCSSCHNPHGTINDHLVKGDSLNDLCLSCHQELRGPFLWEHSPVREDCATCHKPHGSNHDKLLVARASQLCQSCHLQGRHQTVAGLDAAMWNSNRACLNCHSQVHGSNHPSGPLFQR